MSVAQPKPIQAYQAKDGSLFVNERQATTHNRWLAFKTWYASRENKLLDTEDLTERELFDWLDAKFADILPLWSDQ
jgi:hypothetical protein